MANKKIKPLPSTDKMLKQMGEQIKLVRLQRHISETLAADRADVSRSTLWKVENGMDRDFLLIAKDDELGRKLQDIELLRKGRR